MEEIKKCMKKNNGSITEKLLEELDINIECNFQCKHIFYSPHKFELYMNGKTDDNRLDIMKFFKDGKLICVAVHNCY